MKAKLGLITFTGIRPVTLFSGQWADMKLVKFLKLARKMGYQGVELACWGDHFDPVKAADTKHGKGYCASVHRLLKKNKLKCYAISTHLVGQAICDNIDKRHQAILPKHVWNDFKGGPEGVRQRASLELQKTAVAAKNFGVSVVNGFTGSSIWPQVYEFPPSTPTQIEDGFKDAAARLKPILDVFTKCGVKYALEVHPTEIAFDIASAQRLLEALENHPAFGFNYDPSHFGYQGVDYVQFLYTFKDRIFHVHMKDVAWNVGDGKTGVFGGHVTFHTGRRFWDFRSVGRGHIKFEEIIRALNDIRYAGPLSVEWEDGRMDRIFGATESCKFVKALQFPVSKVVFDEQFAEASKGGKKNLARKSKSRSGAGKKR